MRVAPIIGSVIITLGQTLYLLTVQFLTTNYIVSAAIFNLIFYYFVFLLLAWGYRKLKLPARGELLVILILPVFSVVSACYKLASDLASVGVR